VIHGECINAMQRLDDSSVDFILTDPPYITNYRSRDGRNVINDDNDAWLAPAYAQMYRVLRPDVFCVSFYGWGCTDLFVAAWKKAGFGISGHIVFRKSYTSSSYFLQYQAYLLDQWPAASACQAATGRDRLDLHRKPSASDAEARRGSATTYLRLHETRRRRSRSLLRLRLDARRRAPSATATSASNSIPNITAPRRSECALSRRRHSCCPEF
jgi:hypothetical protein